MKLLFFDDFKLGVLKGDPAGSAAEGTRWANAAANGEVCACPYGPFFPLKSSVVNLFDILH